MFSFCSRVTLAGVYLNAVAHCSSPHVSSVGPRTQPQPAVKIWFWQTEASFTFQVLFFILFFQTSNMMFHLEDGISITPRCRVHTSFPSAALIFEKREILVQVNQQINAQAKGDTLHSFKCDNCLLCIWSLKLWKDLRATFSKLLAPGLISISVSGEVAVPSAKDLMSQSAFENI